jgi:hypothetical protein
VFERCLLGSKLEPTARGGVDRQDRSLKAQAFFSFDTGRPFTRGTIAYACMPRAEAERQPGSVLLTKLGWVTFEDRPAVVGLRDRAICPALVLTPQGKAASAAWQSRPDLPTGSTLWSVPVGDRELLEVTGLTGAPDGSTVVEFNWKWKSNHMGDTLAQSIDRASGDSLGRSDAGSRCDCVDHRSLPTTSDPVSPREQVLTLAEAERHAIYAQPSCSI